MTTARAGAGLFAVAVLGWRTVLPRIIAGLVALLLWLLARGGRTRR